MASKLPPLRPILYAIPAIAAATVASYITVKVRRYPLIVETKTITKSLADSHSLTKVVNPKHHQVLGDTRTIVLSKEQVGEMKDEEILSRMVRGFYSGWSFFPEKCLVRTLWEVGWGSMIRCEFVGTKP